MGGGEGVAVSYYDVSFDVSLDGAGFDAGAVSGCGVVVSVVADVEGPVC